ncbi:MAG: amino acid synthesis family protein [Pseudomonadota bacterium]
MMRLRKLVVSLEETHREQSQALNVPTRKAVAMAVISNPFATLFAPDLTPLVETGAELGQLLAARAVAALGILPDDVQSYGKAAMVGEDGELEHAAALLHPAMGAAIRAETGGGKALIPSAKKRGGPGHCLDVPLGHKDAAYVRSHFDAIEARITDAPRAAEILVAVAVTDSGRPLSRVGGLTVNQIEGSDGLR